MARAEEKHVWTRENDEGEEYETPLPGKYEVCHRCRGKGTHVNPNVDGHGITEEEWARDWSPEEREDYKNGGYDITCLTCNGKRVEWVVDLDAMEPTLRAQYEEHLREEAEYAQLCAMERKYGC